MKEDRLAIEYHLFKDFYYFNLLNSRNLYIFIILVISIWFLFIVKFFFIKFISVGIYTEIQFAIIILAGLSFILKIIHFFIELYIIYFKNPPTLMKALTGSKTLLSLGLAGAGVIGGTAATVHQDAFNPDTLMSPMAKTYHRFSYFGAPAVTDCKEYLWVVMVLVSTLEGTDYTQRDFIKADGTFNSVKFFHVANTDPAVNRNINLAWPKDKCDSFSIPLQVSAPLPATPSNFHYPTVPETEHENVRKEMELQHNRDNLREMARREKEKRDELYKDLL